MAGEMELWGVSELLDVDERFLRELQDIDRYFSMGVRVYKPPKKLQEISCFINGFFSVVDLKSVKG